MKQQTTLSTTGQAFTLEGIVSGMLLISVALIFSLQVTAITPLSASTSSQHIENQQAELAQGLIESTPREDIVQTLLYWNNSTATYHNSDPDGQYRVDPPNTEFGNAVENILLEKGVGVNINVFYYEESSYQDNKLVLFTTGAPSNHGFTVQRRIPLYDDTKLYYENGTKSNISLENSSFYVDDINKNTELYNIVIVRITVWRI